MKNICRLLVTTVVSLQNQIPTPLQHYNFEHPYFLFYHEILQFQCEQANHVPVHAEQTQIHKYSTVKENLVR
jgi:hypothetical protein